MSFLRNVFKKWDYCENCGKKGAKLYEIYSRKYAFCSDTCRDQFGEKLYYGNATMHCPYCGFLQPLRREVQRVCESCHNNMNAL